MHFHPHTLLPYSAVLKAGENRQTRQPRGRIQQLGGLCPSALEQTIMRDLQPFISNRKGTRRFACSA
jgi:hypothetical protein